MKSQLFNMDNFLDFEERRKQRKDQGFLLNCEDRLIVSKKGRIFLNHILQMIVV